jgi:hypothetical protein
MEYAINKKILNEKNLSRLKQEVLRVNHLPEESRIWYFILLYSTNLSLLKDLNDLRQQVGLFPYEISMLGIENEPS